MNFDLLSSIELTASAAIVVATYVALFGENGRERLMIAGTLTCWFFAVVWAGTSGALGNVNGLGTPGLGAAVVLPVVVLCVIGFGLAANRARLLAVPLTAVTAIQAIRVLGVSFVLLYAAHRLPAPFAPVAGWGDIAIGAIALPLAFSMARNPHGNRAALLIWNVLGMFDLVAAIALGATSSPGPIRLFFEPPGSGIMTTLPWIIIPCFLVPALAFFHLVTLYRLAQERRRRPMAVSAAF